MNVCVCVCVCVCAPIVYAYAVVYIKQGAHTMQCTLMYNYRAPRRLIYNAKSGSQQLILHYTDKRPDYTYDIQALYL